MPSPTAARILLDESEGNGDTIIVGFTLIVAIHLFALSAQYAGVAITAISSQALTFSAEKNQYYKVECCTNLIEGNWEFLTVIPTGFKGDTGDIGPQGNTGDTGPQGDTGTSSRT